MAFFATPVSSFLPRYNGEFQVGAFVRFFDAGTNTPKTMYQDGALNAEFDPNDITSDANAQFPAIWGQGGAYRAIVTTAGGNVIRDMDNLPGDVAAGGGGGGGGGTNIPVGFYMEAHATGVQADWVRANGRTIGAAASGAQERANADCEALFLHLWTVDALLAVSGGRGASAAADWAANKTIELPSRRGRGGVGLDDMGSTPAGLLAGFTFTTGNATTLGSTCGTATVALSEAHNGPHTHTGNTSTDGNHQHSGTTAANGSHTHSGLTSINGLHQHTTSVPASGLFAVGAGGAPVPSNGSADYPSTADGSHQHSLVIDANGSHQHTIITDAAGSHAHSFNTASSGSGTAHLNMQPSMLVTVYIKL